METKLKIKYDLDYNIEPKKQNLKNMLKIYQKDWVKFFANILIQN